MNKSGFYLTVIACLLLCGKTVFADDWKEFKKNHFIIYYKNAPIGFVESVDEMAEYYYTEITKNLGFVRYEGWAWDKRAKIYIFDDKEDFVENGRQANWSHGVASPNKKIIYTYPASHGFFDSTLPHELGHIIFREFIGLRVQIPSWFEEGVAMYQEKAKRWGANKYVREALASGDFMPLKELNLMRLSGKSNQDRVSLFYAESASVVYFMISEYGEQRFVRFCRKLKDGSRFEDALEAIYARFKDVDKLNEAWVNHIQ